MNLNSKKVTAQLPTWWSSLLLFFMILSATSCRDHQQPPLTSIHPYFLAGGSFEKYMDSLSQSSPYAFSGVVLVGKDGVISFKKAYGYADDEAKTLNTLTTRFNLASVGKMFTAVGIMRLVQEGKLTLTDNLGKFFPDITNEKTKTITISQLLTHTAGMGNALDDPDLKGKTLNHQQQFSILKNKPLLYNPGKAYAYSNTGFVTLGAVIEKVTGRDFYEYINELILSPLRMTNTGYYQKKDNYPDMAKGYMLDKIFAPTKKIETSDRVGDQKGTAAGGAWGTVEDMFKFTHAIVSRQLLDDKHTRLLLDPILAEQEPILNPDGTFQYEDAPVREGHKRGLGSETIQFNGINLSGHTGGIFGYSAVFFVNPETGYVIVSFQNVDPEAKNRAAAENRFTRLIKSL
ncbi:serine hydrolase domain-containing protein [Larkinella soli]|uniref:serine hydrolase domain-containing protein n=1 Tax=Larkinella soli TaxID=1770527 RepID=UPI000FFCC114|nr:serine hydrolase domain-containing protein [Larkinella soli]